MNKAELRKFYLAKRNALTIEDYLLLNQQLCLQVMNHIDFSGLQTVHIFLPIVDKKEVNTLLIIDRLREAFPKLDLLTSITEIQSNSLKTCRLLPNAEIKTNPWGIPEPVEVIEADPKSIDLIFVPLLTFDAQGHRVGYGKGFYDRYFTQCRPNVQKVGLSLFNRMETIDDVSPTDIPLTSLITPLARFEF